VLGKTRIATAAAAEAGETPADSDQPIHAASGFRSFVRGNDTTPMMKSTGMSEAAKSKPMKHLYDAEEYRPGDADPRRMVEGVSSILYTQLALSEIEGKDFPNILLARQKLSQNVSTMTSYG
jgi:hypothetical protein